MIKNIVSVWGIPTTNNKYYILTSSFQGVPSLNPKRMVNWHPETEPFGTPLEGPGIYIISTPPKFHMEPEKKSPEKEKRKFLLETIHFQVPC